MAFNPNYKMSTNQQETQQRAEAERRYRQARNVAQKEAVPPFRQTYVRSPHPVVLPTNGTRDDFVTAHIPMTQNTVGVPVQAHMGAVSTNNPHWGVVYSPRQHTDLTPLIAEYAQRVMNIPTDVPVMTMKDALKLMPKPPVTRVPQPVQQTQQTQQTPQFSQLQQVQIVPKASTAQTPPARAFVQSSIFGESPNNLPSTRYQLLPQYNMFGTKGPLVWDGIQFRPLLPGETIPKSTLTFMPRVPPTSYYSSTQYPVWNKQGESVLVDDSQPPSMLEALSITGEN